MVVSAQIQLSTCVAPDSIRSLYKDDADRMIVRRAYRQQAYFMDSAEIPQGLSDTVLDAIMAVYNSTFPERDSVFDIYGIHTFPDYEMRQFWIMADSSLPWMQALSAGTIPTGNAPVDVKLNRYGMQHLSHWDWPGTSDRILTMEADTNYNLMNPVTADFVSLSDVSMASPNGWGGDGNNIWDSLKSDHIQLVFSRGWGDCPSLCIYRRNWRFKVYYDDCSVQFMDAYMGNAIFNDVKEVEYLNWSVFPNPTTSEASIESNIQIEEIQISDLTGRLILTQVVNANTPKVNIEDFPAGPYLLQIKSENGTSVKTIIKN